MDQSWKLAGTSDKKIIFFQNAGLAILSVFLWGMCAHVTGLAGALLSHDSLREMYTEGIIGYAGLTPIEWKIAIGRFLWPAYQRVFRLFGTTVLPFWSGLLGFFWLSVTAWVMADLLHLSKKRYVFLLGGVLTCNLAVISTIGTYIHDFDANMFGVMLAALAAKRILQKDHCRWLAVPLLACAMGTYQSNVSVFICLIIFVCILRLAENRDAKEILRDGVRAVITIILAGVLYYLLTVLVSKISHVELTSTGNGIAKLWSGDEPFNVKKYVGQIIVTYREWFDYFFHLDDELLNILHLILFLSLAVTGVFFLKSRISVLNKCLVFVLVALLPLGMDFSGFVNGYAHLLMTFSFWLLYVLAMIAADRIPEGSRTKLISCVKNATALLVVLIMLHHVQLANGVHFKKNIEKQSTLSYMTRVVGMMDGIPEYHAEQNEVLFIGIPNIKTSKAYSSLEFIGGADHDNFITGTDMFQNYFDYVLQYPIRVVRETDREEILRKVDESSLGVFPEANCYTWVEDKLIIRLE